MIGATDHHEYSPEQFSTCVEVAEEATNLNVSPVIAISTSYEESRFNRDAVSYNGCCHGALQINPSYFCPNRRLHDCNLIQGGIIALRNFHFRYARKNMSESYHIHPESNHQEWSSPLCHYNAGNQCTRRSEAYARRIIRRADRLSDIVYNLNVISKTQLACAYDTHANTNTTYSIK